MECKINRIIQNICLALLICIFFSVSTGRCEDYTGIDPSVEYMNQLIENAQSSVAEGDFAQAKKDLEYTAKNLENSSTWAAVIWAERHDKPDYVPVTLKDLPDELTVKYYTDKMDETKDKYEELLVNIGKAQIAQKKQELKTMLSVLFNAIKLTSEIVGTIKSNPIFIPKKLSDMNENSKKAAEYIEKKLRQIGKGRNPCSSSGRPEKPAGGHLSGIPADPMGYRNSCA